MASWLTRRRDDTGAEQARVGEVTLRLAVLLQVGIAPARAWGYLAEGGDPAAGAVAARIDSGQPVAEALYAHATAARDEAKATTAAQGWLDLAAAWQVATVVGAPLAETLRNTAAALENTQRVRDEVSVTLAEPAATAKLIGLLPLVAIALGVALGFDTLIVLFASPIGIGCLIGGIVLVTIAHLWTRSLVRSTQHAGAVPGLEAELLAIALSGGVSIERARTLVRDATDADTGDAVTAVLDLSRRAGAPAVELLRATAAMLRHRALTDGRLRAARLSTRLLLPLGVCTLPAFLLLGVAPMMLSVMSVVPLQP